MTDADNADDLILLTNPLTQDESLLQNLEWTVGEIDFYVNENKTDYMCFKQKGAISTLRDKTLELLDLFTCLGSNISSTESNFRTYQVKRLGAINKVSSTR